MPNGRNKVALMSRLHVMTAPGIAQRGADFLMKPKCINGFNWYFCALRQSLVYRANADSQYVKYLFQIMSIGAEMPKIDTMRHRFRLYFALILFSRHRIDLLTMIVEMPSIACHALFHAYIAWCGVSFSLPAIIYFHISGSMFLWPVTDIKWNMMLHADISQSHWYGDNRIRLSPSVATHFSF